MSAHDIGPTCHKLILNNQSRRREGTEGDRCPASAGPSLSAKPSQFNGSHSCLSVQASCGPNHLARRGDSAVLVTCRWRDLWLLWSAGLCPSLLHRSGALLVAGAMLQSRGAMFQGMKMVIVRRPQGDDWVAKQTRARRSTCTTPRSSRPARSRWGPSTSPRVRTSSPCKSSGRIQML